MLSYFWDSELHLAFLALAFESFAGTVELVIEIWLRRVRAKKTDEAEHRKEQLESAFRLIAAVCFIVAIVVTWRIVVLQGAHEAQQKNQEELVKRLEIKLAEESKRADELKAEMRPRHLTDAQFIKLVQALRLIPKEGISLKSQESGREAADFKDELFRAFTSAGFSCSSISVVGTWPVVYPKGVAVVGKKWPAPNPVVRDLIKDALQSAGIEISPIQTHSEAEGRDVTILVGEKPNAELEKAQNAASNALAKASEIEAKGRARHITVEQRAKFKELLENAPRGNVGVTTLGDVDTETETYADEIRQMVNFAGYNAGGRVGFATGGGVSRKGIRVAVKSAFDPTPFAGAMLRTLNEIGIAAEGSVASPDLRIGYNEIIIIVGLKP